MGREAETESSVAVTFRPIEAAILRVLDGLDRGRAIPIGRQPVVVGTHASCDLVLRDAKVSRRHCEVSIDAQGFRLRDLGSRNGTRFEGARVGDIFLPIGAIVRVGGSHFVLSIGADGAGSRALSARSSFGEIVGASLPMRRTYALLEQAAASDVTVLLGGETGTGKELAARAIHEASARARGPFEVFDCGGVAPTLIADELFGHVRGAFTGAGDDRTGVFERASGGTVFLDEIAELPLAVQSALLRVCDRGEVVRVGTSETLRTDVRIVAATHRDLADAVLRGSFREDLYYRLQVYPIGLPPLRERRDDIPMLVANLLTRFGVADPGPIDGPSLVLLRTHAWPGNVRELANVLRRAVAMVGTSVGFEALPIEIEGASFVPGAAADDDYRTQRQRVLSDFDRNYLTALMHESAGNVRSAARASGIERTQLRRLLRRYGLL